MLVLIKGVFGSIEGYLSLPLSACGEKLCGKLKLVEMHTIFSRVRGHMRGEGSHDRT